MATIGNLPGERLAGLTADLFHKIQHGKLSLDELALFTQRKNPFVWERNQNGHVVLTITGLDLTGAAEVDRLKEQKYNVGNLATSCFKSTKADSYDQNHRLVNGQTYRSVLVPGKEVERTSDRTTAGLLAFAERLGYLRPQAGIIPRLRERLTDKQLREELGLWYIAALHQPIEDADGNPRVLELRRGVDGRFVGAYWDRPEDQWRDDGAFVFLLPASSEDLVTEA